MLRNLIGVLFLALSVPLSSVAAHEYFVSTDGCDETHDGRSPGTAFATIQRGVNALEPGDTLTIRPGEYREAVEREDLGNAEEQTLIRAQIPGTVLLRGDVAAPDFEPVDNYRFVYKAPFEHEPQTVNEVDTLRIFEIQANVSDVEFNPGSFFYDREEQSLYISTSDLRAPEEHYYTVSTIETRAGLFLKRPENVTIEGISATGFHSNERFSRLRGGDSQSDAIPWGVYIWLGKNVVVRDVTTYLNAGGIGLISRDRGDNIVERCTSYGNYSRHGSGTANIFGNRANNDIFRDNYAYTGDDAGIRFHGAGQADSTHRIEHSLSWGHSGADFQDKAGSEGVICCVVTTGNIRGRNTVNNSIMGSGSDGENNIYLDQEAGLDKNLEFADHVNLDYRLQETSRFRGAGPDGEDRGPFPYEENIYYVSPDGDDAADGLSVENAWRSPQYAFQQIVAGDTLYLEEGAYDENLRLSVDSTQEEAPVRIRGRGAGEVLIHGDVNIEGAGGVEFERLHLLGRVDLQNSRDILFKNTRFVHPSLPFQAAGTEALRIEHCEFTGFEKAALELEDCSEVFLQGNIFDNSAVPAVVSDGQEAVLYSDYNSYRRPDAVWEVSGMEWSMSDLQQYFDKYSQVREPEYEHETGAVSLQNPGMFIPEGPFGRNFGIYRERERYAAERPLRVDGPELHSVTATTANLEWVSSNPAVFTVHWGPTEEMKNSRTLTAANAYHPSDPLENFNTFSLNGLEPDTEYFLELEFNQSAGDDTENYSISFRTAAADPEPQTYYVAPDGDDTHSGLSRDAAWRTLNHAAGMVRPGDTVLIGEGIYREMVRVRVTGEKDARIAFKAHPGEKVVIDGKGKTLEGAFRVFNNKDYLDFDGLYLQDFLRGPSGSARYGAIGILRSRDIRVTRMFHDGRQSGTDPEILTAADAENLLIKNCVSIGGWDGIGLGSSRDIRIENTVIIRPLIRAIPGGNRKDIQVRNSVIGDNLAKKRNSFLVPRSITLENNCFFLRWPEQERSVFGGGEEGMLLEQYHEEQGIEKENITANPQFALFQEEQQFADSPYFQDGMVGRMEDFNDLFATNPELTERGIGLEREAFSDFHFHRDE